MGWKNRVLPKKHISSDVSKNKENIFYNTVCRHLQIWMYSWMTKACENKHEYLISKMMFFKFLHTRQIAEKLVKSLLNQLYIPSKFKASEFPKCINFPNLKVTQDQLSSNMFNVTGLTQYATTFGTDDTFFEDFMKNPDFYNEAISTSKPNGQSAKSNAYHELLPYYKDLVNQMENHTEEEMCEVKQMFTEQTGRFQRNALVMKDSKKRKYVSSSIPSSKKKTSWNQLLIKHLCSVN